MHVTNIVQIDGTINQLWLNIFVRCCNGFSFTRINRYVRDIQMQRWRCWLVDDGYMRIVAACACSFLLLGTPSWHPYTVNRQTHTANIPILCNQCPLGVVSSIYEAFILIERWT